jgi:hypothetical protein
VSVRAKVVAVAANVAEQAQGMKKRAEELGRSTMEQISVSRDLVASGDDVVLYMSTTRDLWKFPIVDQSGAQVGSLDIWASSSCGEDCVQKGDGRDLWWFTPDHEPFNVLTYSSRAPEDFNPANRIMVGEKVTLGPNEHQVPPLSPLSSLSALLLIRSSCMPSPFFLSFFFFFTLTLVWQPNVHNNNNNSNRWHRARANQKERSGANTTRPRTTRAFRWA